MTCIVAVKNEKKGTVILGADSAGAQPEGGWTAPFRTQKLFRKGPYVIGYSGAYTFGQGVHKMHFLEPPVEGELRDFMEKTFRQSLIDQSLDFLPEPNKDGTLIVAIKGSIFYIENDYGILEPASPYFSIGSGADFAYGSLYSTTEWPSVRLRALEALCAAAEFNPGGVCRPFSYLETEL